MPDVKPGTGKLMAEKVKTSFEALRSWRQCSDVNPLPACRS
jgi:hypothetical protein